jgi:glycosyltransferase involved in cell wall biosynthesis
VSPAFNGYWERFGKVWTSHILKLNPQPTEVIVVSDKPIVTQFKCVIESDIHIASFRNAGVKAATSDWVAISDLDDQPFPNFLTGIDDSYDVIAGNYISIDRKPVYSDPNIWSRLLDADAWNPMSHGGSIFRRSLLLQVPYRRIGWEDWALWIDLYNAGARVKFDREVRYFYNKIPNSLSSQNPILKNQEIAQLKLLVDKRIK